MRKYMMIFSSSFISGLCIALGATGYLMSLHYGNRFIGAFIFGIGLFTIINFGLWLYTGKVGRLLDNKPKYLLDLLVCVIGNFLGVLFLSSMITFTRYGDILKEQALPIINAKQDDNPFSIFALSFLCGIMIYLAVVGHEICTYNAGKILFAYLPIVLFILCGFEHCVANVTYYVYAHHFSLKMVLYLFIMIIGNGVGSVFFDSMIKLVLKLKTEKKKTEATDSNYIN
ncbi:MAG: formate/nitrite transporter family protein [Acholeplasmatales bacterium]|nr:formate/nitrite transporter family protein [Acholeplasmatales bacterium]